MDRNVALLWRAEPVVPERGVAQRHGLSPSRTLVAHVKEAAVIPRPYRLRESQPVERIGENAAIAHAYDACFDPLAAVGGNPVHDVRAVRTGHEARDGAPRAARQWIHEHAAHTARRLYDELLLIAARHPVEPNRRLRSLGWRRRFVRIPAGRVLLHSADQPWAQTAVPEVWLRHARLRRRPPAHFRSAEIFQPSVRVGDTGAMPGVDGINRTRSRIRARGESVRAAARAGRQYGRDCQCRDKNLPHGHHANVPPADSAIQLRNARPHSPAFSGVQIVNCPRDSRNSRHSRS